jgi:hypothetical protein
MIGENMIFVKSAKWLLSGMPEPESLTIDAHVEGLSLKCEMSSNAMN